MVRLWLLAWLVPFFASGAAVAQIVPGVPISPQGSTAVEASHIAKPAPGNLASFHVDTGSSAVTVMLWDGTSEPADGTLTGCGAPASTRPCLLTRYQFPANNSYAVDLTDAPLPFQQGIVLICSSNGPFVKARTAACTFSNIQVQ